ncbi:MAG: NmrA family NAD(P)-binding protein, partial [Pseudomonadota bacterium]
HAHCTPPWFLAETLGPLPGVETVAVFGATGRQGLAQLESLTKAGYKAIGVTRAADRLKALAPEAEPCLGDYDDPGSLKEACARADAIFVNGPSFQGAERTLDRWTALSAAAAEGGVQQIVLNTSMWAPKDEPCGDAVMDSRLAAAQALKSAGVPVAVVCPVLFMDNLLANWVKPRVVNEGVFAYGHKPGLRAGWICLDDVAEIMTYLLSREDLKEAHLPLAGPEDLTPEDIAAQFSKTLGKDVVFEPMTPQAFADGLADVFKDILTAPPEMFAAGVAGFYSFNNDLDGRYLRAEWPEELKGAPIKLTSLAEWMPRQDWVVREGGPVGG